MKPGHEHGSAIPVPPRGALPEDRVGDGSSEDSTAGVHRVDSRLRSGRTWNLRTHLLALAGALLLPTLTLAGAAAWQAAAWHRAAAEGRLRDTARALSLALDREISGVTVALIAFATSPAFGSTRSEHDLPTLYRQARQIADRLESSIYLVERDGSRLLTTRTPFGAPLPPVNNRDLVEQVFATGRPVVGNLIVGSVSRALTFAVGVPVLNAQGEVTLVAGASLETGRVHHLLAAQDLPVGALAGVTDASGVLVARSDALQEARVGKSMPAVTATRFTEAGSGFLRGVGMDGLDRVFAFQAVPSAPGWTLFVAETAVAFDSAWHMLLFVLGYTAALALVLGAGLAAGAARRLTRPLAALARSAQAISAASGHADPGVVLTSSSVREYEVLRASVEAAQGALARRAEAERAAAAALAARERLLNAVLDALPVGVVIADATGCILRDNAAHRALWGIPPATEGWQGYGEWLGWRVTTGARLGAEDWAMARALLRGETVRDELVECERFDDREHRFFLNNAAPVRDAEGRIIGGVVAEMDVTARQRAETELAQNRAQLAEAAERVQLALDAGAIIGTWNWELPTDHFTADERFARSFGLDPERCRMGLGIKEVVAGVHPDDIDRLRAAIAEALARGGPYRCQYRVKQWDGVYRWLEANGRVDHAPDGTPSRFPGVLLDIEGRRQTEVALAESEVRFRTMADNAPAMVWATDPVGHCTYLNRPWCEFTGQREEDGFGFGWLDAVHPDDRDRVRETFMAAVARRAPYRVELRLRRLTGDWAWVIDAATPCFGPAGECLGYIGSALDISDRKTTEDALRASEERFRAAVRAVSGILWTNNARGEMAGEQPGWAALTGQCYDEYQGYGWTKAVHPDDAQPTVEAWHDAVAARKIFIFEHRVRTAAAGWRRFTIRAIPVLDEVGAIVEWVGVHTDVTEQREAEAVLARSREELEHLVEERTAALRASEGRLAEAARMEALGRLAGGIAHDFNNVLQAIQGGIALAAKRLKRDPEGAMHFLDLTSESVQRGTAVTNRLLSFARRGELEATAIEPAPMLEGLVHMLRHTLGPKVRLRVDVMPKVPAALADAGQLEAVLVNLANNARDALPDGAGTVTFAAAPAAACIDLPSGDYVRISVSDDGHGMAPELLSRVMEPFFTTKPKGKGTGLGLAMARGFAEQSGGTLTIQSNPGRGTTVSLLLPCATASDAMTQFPAGPGGDGSPPGPAASVMVVDDEAIVRTTLAAALAEQGHTVLEAEDAATALGRLDEGAMPDVLVTDLSMPGALDGLGLICEARRRRPGLPAVLVTGHVGDAGRGALERAAGAGPFAVLRKPVAAQAIEHQVTLLLHGERRAREAEGKG